MKFSIKDQVLCSQLRKKLLLQPRDLLLWTQLFQELNASGDYQSTQFDSNVVPSFREKDSHDSGLDREPWNPPKDVLTLDQLAHQASEVLESSGKPWIVLSVLGGTITLASSSLSPRNAALFLPTGQSHVQVKERLVYRDPATGVRITCLDVQPIQLGSLQTRALKEYEIDYGGVRCRLQEVMPDLKVPMRLELEAWNGTHLRGWMGFDASDLIPRIPSVVMCLDGKPLSVLSPSKIRLDVSDALGSAYQLVSGFELLGLRRLISQESSELQFRDPVTYELVGSFILNRYRAFYQQIMDISKGFCGFNFQTRDGEVVLTSLPKHQDQLPVRVNKSHKVDILVPVYKNWQLTRKCLVSLRDSVSFALSEDPDREIYIHVTNDCSPENAVNSNLMTLCDDIRAIYNKNCENLGFIRTVNNFLTSTAADVILINSDVILSRSCIHELLKARTNLGSNLASLTAFSNNATIFSYPRQIVDNPVSSPGAIERIAQAFQARADEDGATATYQVPVSHGYLMYLSRTALDVVGVFDESFGKGYGEEVDWAMRSAMKGFEHHVCASAYAFHKGSASFGTNLRLSIVRNSNKIIAGRYPFYDEMVKEFINADEFRSLRNMVAVTLLRTSSNPIHLHVTHSSGGGIDTYIRCLKNASPQEVHVLLRPGRSFSDMLRGDAFNKLFDFTLECDEVDAVIIDDLKGAIIQSLTLLLPKLVNITIHSFVGWKASEIEDLMKFLAKNHLSYSIVGHDYMVICPRIKLIDSEGEFCDVGDSARCGHCLRTGKRPVETSLLGPYVRDINLYRNFFDAIVEGAEKFICSTQEQAERFVRLGFDNVVVKEPFEAPFSLLPGDKHDPSSRNVVIFGGVSMEKGADRLFHVASHCLHINPSVHFYLIGSTSNQNDLTKLPNFTVVTSYQTFNELYDAVHSIYSPIVLFPAIWPETWCFTLSEALMMGLPIIAPSLGAFASRLAMLRSHSIKLFNPMISDKGLAELVSEGIGKIEHQNNKN